MAKDTLDTTAPNRPHKSGIHYSAKGYDEYRADLIQRLESRGIVLRDDDFIQAFIDLTAYLGEVLMTYQNAYAQEIYLETAQLRESLFNFALVVDYRIDPGAAATGTLIVLAKPDKAGTLPKGFQIAGKEEGADKKVFFETDNETQVDSQFNNFTLGKGERFKDIEITDMDANPEIIVQKRIVVAPGQYLYFYDNTLIFFAQVQSSEISETENTTTIAFNSLYASPPSYTLKVGSAHWQLINKPACRLFKIVKSSSTVWLDHKYENIAKDSPIIIRLGATLFFGRVQALSFDRLCIRTGVVSRITKGYDMTPTEPTVPDDMVEGEEVIDSYKIDTISAVKKFFVVQRTLTETREVTKLTVTWHATAPDDFNASATATDPIEESALHMAFVGTQTLLRVQPQSINAEYLNGADTLTVDGDFSNLEKYRPLMLHGLIGEKSETEQVRVMEALYDAAADRSYIDLKTPISKNFTKHGVAIWGNVVDITQGKTVPATVLGSGWGEASFQSFDLPQSPLTHERRGREGIKAALDVKVNDLPWQQKDDFLSSGPHDRHFTVQTGYDGQSRIMFGDGANGARLPTGRDNVVAGCRIGQGTPGNVSEKVLKKPVSKPAFLMEVFNTGRTVGGSDADTREELRAKIPVEHLTFDRAVSLTDYADLALAYPGVGKAKAGWRWIHNRQVVYLAVVGEDGQDLTAILPDLRYHLDARRDINQPLLVEPVCLVPLTIVMQVVALEGVDRDRLEDAVTAALGTGRQADGTPQFFNFERLALGMSIHKKDIYRLVEGISGVKSIKSLSVVRSEAVCSDGGYQIPALCAEDVWIHNWELAALDRPHLEITVLQPPVNKVCTTLGI